MAIVTKNAKKYGGTVNAWATGLDQVPILATMEGKKRVTPCNATVPVI